MKLDGSFLHDPARTSQHIFSFHTLHLSIGRGVFLFVLDSFARMQPTTNGSTLRGLLLPAARDILLGFGEYSSRC